MKKNLYLLISLVVVLLSSSCMKEDNTATLSEKKNIKTYAEKFMPIEVLEKSGFEHIKAAQFELLFEDEVLYILNCKDFLMVKFSGDKPQCKFRTRKGQAPGEMITPYSLFRYNENTIVIFDELKKTVFFFDNELNLTKEIKINARFEDMTRMGKNIVATYSSLEEDMFSLLNENFQVTQAIVNTNKTFPFKRLYKHNLNKGFFLGENLVSHSYSMFLYKKCKANIHSVNTGELVVTLNWEQPFSPTAHSIDKRKNCYFLYHVGKYGSYYVVHALYSKTLLGSRDHHEFMIFDEKGALRYEDDFPNHIMAVSKKTPDSKLYFMDDEEGISYIDIEEFMK